MYVGRLLVIGPSVGAYRVSSRSFPNRKITDRDGMLTVVPTEDAPPTDNPYVSYNCVRTVGDTAVLGNGSHVDPITEKIGLGYPARDAVAESLLALDYEKDDYDTPRIAGTIDRKGEAFLGIVRRDAIIVHSVEEPTIIATYELDAPELVAFPAETAEDAAVAAYDLEYEHPVCAAGVSSEEDGFELAVENRIED